MICPMLKPEEVDRFWIPCRTLLLKAFRGHVHLHNVDDYYPKLKDGSLQLWVALNDNQEIKASAITSVDEGSEAKLCNILSLGGESLPEWVDELDKNITDFAEKNGCDAIEYVGREGFSHYATGYKKDGIVFVKKIKDKS